MKRLVGLIVLALCGCEAPDERAFDGDAANMGRGIYRTAPDEHGVACYQTETGGISCLQLNPPKAPARGMTKREIIYQQPEQ